MHLPRQILYIIINISFLLLSPVAILFTGIPSWCDTPPTVTVFSPTTPTGKQESFIIEINGTNLLVGDTPRILVFPATGTGEVSVLGTPTATQIRAEFSAPSGYVLGEVVLSHASGAPVPISIAKTTCSTETDIKSEFSLVKPDQVKEKYGNGVAKNFDVFEFSLVNECPLPVVVPLAGIQITITHDSQDSTVVPFSLDHVTSVYSTDRKLTGSRAIFFNVLQALATLGSAVEPFFGRGFTQGVSIWGGGFTQAMTTVFKDMSAEQLQNLTSQSFGSTEQLGPNGGSLQKFLFVPKIPTGPKKKDKLSLATPFAAGKVDLKFEAIPTTTPQTAAAKTG